MKKIVALLMIVTFAVGCSNSETETNTLERKDSTVIKDSASPTDNNTVTPPASNGQF